MEAWGCIPPSTIFHYYFKLVDQFLSDLQASTEISIASLLNHDEQATASESVIEEITESYLNYDEDTIHNHVKPYA